MHHIGMTLQQVADVLESLGYTKIDENKQHRYVIYGSSEKLITFQLKEENNQTFVSISANSKENSNFMMAPLYAQNIEQLINNTQ